MKTIVEKLTPEQIAKFPEYRDKWIKIGLMLEDYTLKDERLRELADAMYKNAGLETPKFVIRVKSPFALQIAAHYLRKFPTSLEKFFSDPDKAQVRDQVGAQVGAQVGENQKNSKLEWSDWLYGNFDAGYFSWVDFFFLECGISLPRWESYRELMSNVGMIVPLRGALIVCERPLFIERNRFNRLHAEGRPAIAYSDSYKLWALDGIRFDEEMAQKFIAPKASEIKKEDVLKIKNVEQRAAVIRRIGVKEFIKLLKPDVLDTQDGYELLKVNIGNAERIYIKMQNPSVDEVHIEAVHPECRTVNGALHWRNTGELSGTFRKPLVLT